MVRRVPDRDAVSQRRGHGRRVDADRVIVQAVRNEDGPSVIQQALLAATLTNTVGRPIHPGMRRVCCRAGGPTQGRPGMLPSCCRCLCRASSRARRING